MSVKPFRLLFLQRRSHKAGAQTCLARLLRHPRLRAMAPLVVCGEPGWLPDELAAHGIEVRIQPFPSARSLAGRLWHNRRFVRRLLKELPAGPQNYVVHGNDFQEAPLTLLLGRALAAKTAVFLRSAGMSRADYRKYACAEADLLLTVSEQFLAALRAWETRRPIALVSDGLYADEIMPPADVGGRFPRRFLVIGTPHPSKGWSDLTDALQLLQDKGRLPADALFHFTGDGAAALDLARFPAGKLVFLGRRTDFPGLARDYDFVINPSRMETFGMAALEVVAQGLPLLSSDTGVVSRVVDLPELLFPAGDVLALADRLDRILRTQSPGVEQLTGFQKVLGDRFSIDRSAEALLSAYAALGWSGVVKQDFQ